MPITTRRQIRRATAVADTAEKDGNDALGENVRETSSGSANEASSSSSDSESEEGSTSGGSSNDDEDDMLDKLFKKSLEALQKQEEFGKGKEKTAFAHDEDVITLSDHRPVAQSQSSVERRKDAQKRERAGVSGKEMDAVYADLRSGKTASSNLAKMGKAAQRARREERETTAGSRWFGMPAFGGASSSTKRKQTSGLSEEEERKARRTRLTNPSKADGDGRGPSAEEMRREVQAIRLRNAIDPKRFYRGSVAGDREMPKYAQLGRVISSSTAPASTLNRSERGRTVIDELVRDAEAAAYAKKKFNEHQAKSNVAWSSHVRRHPKKGQGSGRKRR